VEKFEGANARLTHELFEHTRLKFSLLQDHHSTLSISQGDLELSHMMQVKATTNPTWISGKAVFPFKNKLSIPKVAASLRMNIPKFNNGVFVANIRSSYFSEPTHKVAAVKMSYMHPISNVCFVGGGLKINFQRGRGGYTLREGQVGMNFANVKEVGVGAWYFLSDMGVPLGINVRASSKDFKTVSLRSTMQVVIESLGVTPYVSLNWVKDTGLSLGLGVML